METFWKQNGYKLETNWIHSIKKWGVPDGKGHFMKFGRDYAYFSMKIKKGA